MNKPSDLTRALAELVREDPLEGLGLVLDVLVTHSDDEHLILATLLEIVRCVMRSGKVGRGMAGFGWIG